MLADQLVSVGLCDEACDYLAEQAAARYNRQAIRIAGVSAGSGGIGMEVDPDLLMEMFAGIEVGGFEIRLQCIDQCLIDGLNLFEQEMPVTILDRAIGIKPCLKCRKRGRFGVHAWSLADDDDLDSGFACDVFPRKISGIGADAEAARQRKAEAITERQAGVGGCGP